MIHVAEVVWGRDAAACLRPVLPPPAGLVDIGVRIGNTHLVEVDPVGLTASATLSRRLPASALPMICSDSDIAANWVQAKMAPRPIAGVVPLVDA